ncbi:MAG: hypothetical protein ACI4JM_08760 [Oscillospiraceae bacterium]
MKGIIILTVIAVVIGVVLGIVKATCSNTDDNIGIFNEKLTVDSLKKFKKR